MRWVALLIADRAMPDPAHNLVLNRRAVLALAGGGCAVLVLNCASALAAAAPSQSVFVSKRLSVAVRGARGPEGRDVLLIPGLASGPAIWSGLASHLPGHRLHLVRVAGFDGMAAGPNATGPLLTSLASELARYIREARLSAPAVIGHSMGGTLAMMLALRSDVQLGRIMVVDMLPDGAGMVGGTSSGLGYLAAQLNGYFTGTKAGRQLLAQMVRQAPSARNSDPSVIAQALTELAQTDLTAHVRDIPAPLAVLYAVPSDTNAARAQAQRYRTAYAKARSLTLEGVGPSGHMIMLDQPERFAQFVRAFLT